MASAQLGRLEKVDLRDAWSSEANHFTPWLAQEENLSLLGEVIGVVLELESQEKNVGPFRADILCKDTATDSWVLIENQLERTDHTHLGQLLTYAAGLKAVSIVWIARQFTEEHRAALDWLNEHTDESINLFGLEVELWRIGDSSIAPKFNIVSQPNDWSRTVQTEVKGLSPHSQLQRRFWTEFRAHMESTKSPVKCQKPQAQSFMDHAIGRSGMHLSSAVSIWNTETKVKGPEIRAELWVKGSAAKAEFAVLEKQKESIEKELGFPLTWHNLEKNTSCRIFTRKDADFLDESLWLGQFEWLRQHLEKMLCVFGPIVKNLAPEGAVGEAGNA